MTETAYNLEVNPRIPERLERLEYLANNLRCSLDRPTRSLFASLSRPLWKTTDRNLKALLKRVNQKDLETASEKPVFQEDRARVLSAYDTYHDLPSMAHVNSRSIEDDNLIAYFFAEFSFHESLPSYPGGLGMLAGDHCKAASDMALPFIGFGLLYRQGYFHQTIDTDGQQQATYSDSDFEDLPVSPVLDAESKEVRVSIDLPEQAVWANIWDMQGGHVRRLILEGYDLHLSRRLVAGVDVWLNNPIYSLEASCTSGMKEAVNGAIDLSFLDGWWGEGYDDKSEVPNGWAIKPTSSHLDEARRNAEEARTLYELLQDQVIPTYYRAGRMGYSPEWVAISKRSIATIAPRFNVIHMVAEYVQKFYAPAVRLALLHELAKAADIDGSKQKILAGEPINHTQGPAVRHMALRAGEQAPPEVPSILGRWQRFCESVHSGSWRGSDLGQRMATKALAVRPKPDFKLHFIANVDRADFSPLLAKLNPCTTQFIAGSKTFTTQETLTHARRWLLALFEHKVFCLGVLWNLNSFDPWCVELRKQLARQLTLVLSGTADAAASDALTHGLIAALRTP